MTILCGTDLTAQATEAVLVAARIAERTGEKLRLVHVLDLPGAAEALADQSWPPTRVKMHVEGERADLAARLRAEAGKLGLADRTETDVLVGSSDEAVVADAARSGARLVVVGALGRRGGSAWRLGSTADRIAQSSSVPVLVVRRPQGLLDWLARARALRAVVGVEPSSASDAAVRWVAALRAIGPVDAVAVHVYWPPELRERLKIAGAIPIGEGHAEVDRVLERELRERLRALSAGDELDLRIVGGLGRTADHLTEIAVHEKADLVVVGSRQREGFDRLWHGSVSHGVIDGSPVSVACVPSRA